MDSDFSGVHLVVKTGYDSGVSSIVSLVVFFGALNAFLCVKLSGTLLNSESRSESSAKIYF